MLLKLSSVSVSKLNTGWPHPVRYEVQNPRMVQEHPCVKVSQC